MNKALPALSLIKISIILVLFCITSAAQIGWKGKEIKGAGDLVAVFFTSTEKGWVAGDDGYLAFTTNGGKSWSKQSIGTTESINEIYFRNDDNGYLVAGKKMFITRDAGRTWQETRIYRAGDFRGLTPEFLSIRFADKKRGIVIGSLLSREEKVVDSLVMRTQDGGDTWRRVIVPSKKELYHLDFVGSSLCWIVGDSGLILASDDGGSTFTAQSSGTDRALYNVDFRDGSDGYAVGSKGLILRTENGGRNWTRVITSYAETFMRVDFADDKNGWIVGYNGSILRSGDRGRTWIKQECDSKMHFYGLYMTKKYGWAVGANGTIAEYQKN